MTIHAIKPMTRSPASPTTTIQAYSAPTDICGRALAERRGFGQDACVSRIDVEATSASSRVAHSAPVLRRFAAWVLDTVLVCLPPIVAVVAHASDWVLLVALFSAVLISIANDVVLVVRSGQSVGRRIFAVMVLDSKRMTPPGVWQVLWRNLLAGPGVGYAWHPISAWSGFIVVLGPWPFLCYGAIFFDRCWRRGLHDRWSGTVVIDARR
jgi:uncharacterized RDD family membrane protein YckC